VQDLLKDGREGRFFRGNLHCHSQQTDGLLEPDEAVAGLPPRPAHDFLCLSAPLRKRVRLAGDRHAPPSRDETFTHDPVGRRAQAPAPWDACSRLLLVRPAGLP
jgi:hypothetical protein